MKKKKGTSYYVSCLLVQKKKTLSDASHATISTSAPTERQKLPKSQEGEKEDKKGEKEAVKGSGGGGALELVFFFSCGDLCEEIEEPYYLCSPRFSVDSPNWLPRPG